MPVGRHWIAHREDLTSFEDVDGCWIWRGRIAPNGYGRLGSKYAHRVMYELHVGPIPTGLDVDHLCRVRHCVNPRHLEPVTRSENLRRGKSGEAPKLSLRKLTDDQVRYIRSSTEPNTVVGRMFGVSHETIRRVRLRRAYKELA